MLALAILRFAAWEAALFGAAVVLARWLGFRGARRVEEKILAVLAIEITLESTFAAIFSFAQWNAPAGYWMAAVMCAAVAASPRGREGLRRAVRELRNAEFSRHPRTAGLFATLLTPLIFLSFRPVEDGDSINYLHYLIDWMANRATPYTFATNYVAFWELSFLPAWTITRLDFFFPLLALKAVVLLSLALWLLGREFRLRGRLLLWTVFGIVLLQHLWWQFSGVPTLKNDVLHGAGFVLLILSVVRTAGGLKIRRRPETCPATWFAFGAAFASVKYTGIFEAAFAGLLILFLSRRLRPIPMLLAGVFVVATSGHYYIHNLLLYGNPFYPFQINFAFVHLPGTADLSNTSILYNLRNTGVWRAFFLPRGGLSGAGLLFPIILAATPIAAFRRRVPAAVGLLVLAGWLLYFRSVYGAGLAPGDIRLVVSLNTIRYVIGVLAVSELLFVAMIARWPMAALALVVVNAASRLAILYDKLPAAAFPIAAMVAAALAAGLLMALMGRRPLAAALASTTALMIAGPLIDERNHLHWLDWWADLKPVLAAVRGDSLALLAVDDWGYFSGHVLAAGNPVHPEVRAIEAAQLDSIPSSARPRYLAALPAPGSPEASTWRSRHDGDFARWQYEIAVNGGHGAILERTTPPAELPANSRVDAWYAPDGTIAIEGMPVPGGHVLRSGDVLADAAGALLQLGPQGRRPLQPASGVLLFLRNCGDLEFTAGSPRGLPAGISYRRQDGRWIPEIARPVSTAPLPSPSWNTSISDGTYQQEVLSDDTGPFVRLRAGHDARWLIYSAAYPEKLPEGVPLTIQAEVRCPRGCTLSTAGHHPELEKRVQSDTWTLVRLDLAYQKNENGHYAVGLDACRRGEWFDLRSFELRIGVFPYN